LIAAIVGVVAFRSRLAMSDDAYIVLRVVRHALEGDGLRFNAGESGVQVCTSPLNLLLTLALAWIGTLFGMGAQGATLVAVQTLTVLAAPFCAMGVYALAAPRDRGGIAATAAALGIATSPLFLATAGLETSMALGFALWGLFAFTRERFAIAGALLACAILARHDYGILFIVVAVFISRQSERSAVRDRLVRTFAPAVIVLVPWLAFSAAYYGTTVPTTLKSKLAQGGSAYWPETFQSGIWEGIVGVAHGVDVIAAAWIALAMVALMVAARDRARQGDAAICLLSFSALHAIAYSLLGLPRYHWYYVGYGAALALVSAYAIDVWIARRASSRSLSIAAPVAALAFLPMVFRAPEVEMRLASYRATGEYLERHPPKTAAGMKEIGIVGFFAPSVAVFDFAGLATPSQIENVRRSDATAWLSDPSAADVVVLVSSEPPHRDQPLEPRIDPRFEGAYALEVTIDEPVFGDKRMEIWRIKD
jgi:hypothetical protein